MNLITMMHIDWYEKCNVNVKQCVDYNGVF